MRSGARVREEYDEATERDTIPPPALPEDPLIGQEIGGRYRLSRKEAEDRETITYLATHTRIANYETRVHLLATDLRQNKQARSSFRSTWELHALFDVARDHVIRVEDILEEDRCGGPTVVTEALSGFRLDEWLGHGHAPLSVDRVAELCRQLACVLDAMHGQGVTHGDLRPEILCLANVGSHQILKLTSFGTQRNSRQASKLGGGTYRAPEHSTQGVPLGIGADVWSYGLIVHELLTGQVFWLDPNEPRDFEDGNLLPRPSERGVGVRGLAPEVWDSWLTCCLRRDPRHRFPDVMEACRVLQAHLSPPRSRSRPPAVSSDRASKAPSSGVRPSRPLPMVDDPLFSPEARVLRGHRGTVWSLHVTADGHRVVSAGDDGVVRVWDPFVGSLLHELPGVHVGRIRCVAVTPDGRRLISGGHDRTLVIRDLQSPDSEPVKNAIHRSIVTSIAVARDGQRMVTTSEDGTAIVWDLTADRVLWTTPGGNGCVHTAAIMPDGDTFMTGGRDGVVRCWSTHERRCVYMLDGHTGDVHGIAPSSDESLLLTCGKAGQLFLWRGHYERQELHGPRDAITGVVWGVGERWFVTGSCDPDVRVWDVATGRCVQTLHGHEWAVRCVAVDPLGRYICSGSSDGDLRIWSGVR